MKPLLALALLITACTSNPPQKKEIEIPINTVDTFPNNEGKNYRVQKSPGAKKFQFKVDTRSVKDSMIIKNQSK